jgi:hypothetical protein
MLFAGRDLALVRGSDVERDGMFLELVEGEQRRVLADVFYSDADGSYVLTEYAPDTPPEAIAWLKEQAHRLLPPLRERSNGQL